MRPLGAASRSPATAAGARWRGARRAGPSGARALLEAIGLGRRFRGLAAVDNVSLDLNVGEIHAVIGTNGAGKSTLVNMLSGELAAERRHRALRWRRRDALVAAASRARRNRPQLPADDDLRRVQRARELPPRRAGARAARVARLGARCARSRGDRDRRGARSPPPASTATRSASPRTLSHGAKRQLEIAMCLATAPRVLLLDEPLAGMGAEETGRMLDLLVGLKEGHAILLVEHDMDAVFRIADRITVMVNGQVIASDVPARIRADRAVQLAYLGDGH